MSIKPPSANTGDHIGMVLSWCGDYVFQHMALLRAYRRESKDFLGILRKLFRIAPPQMPLVAPRPERENMFRGRIRDALHTTCMDNNITLAEDQVNCFRFLDSYPDPVLLINALAGTGKTFIMGTLIRALLPLLRESSGAIVVLVPSRDARDDLLQSQDTRLAAEESRCKVLWLGRQKEGRPMAQVVWETELERQVAERQKDQIALLRQLEEELQTIYSTLQSLRLDWITVLQSGSLPMEGEEVIRALQLFKQAAYLHMVKMIMDVTKARGAIIEELLREVHVVVGTVDAYCKWRAG